MKLFGKKKAIHVEFVNKETGLVFAKSDMLPENLPETFSLNTTMHLGEENWIVISAEPMSSSEFVQTGKLRLVLQKVKMIDPTKILYTLPSICNDLAEVDENSESSGSELSIDEDDWRNIELVSLSFKQEIETNLREIYQIHQDHTVGQGFRKLHLRTQIEQPFESISLPYEELNSFEKEKVYSGLSYLKKNKLVKNGFAFTTIGGITWYGRRKNNLIQEFCLACYLPHSQIVDDIEILVGIMHRYNLVFIDWCRVFYATSAQKDDLKSYFLQVDGGDDLA